MNVRWSATNLTTPGGQTALVIPASLALVGLVTVGVAYFAGDAEDAGSRLLLQGGLGVFLVFGVITAMVAQRTRATVTLGWDGEQLRLAVKPPGKPVVVYGGPFREEHCFVRSAVHTGRGSIPQLVLMLAIFDEKGRCVLVLRELLGAIYDPPPGWAQSAISASKAHHVLVNSLGRTNLDELASALTKGG
jgi:hypothetical protein